MQRWIIAGLVFLVLLTGGGYFAYRTYQQNRHTRIWLPLPVPELTHEERRERAATLREKLSEPVLMAAVCKDSHYASVMGFSSDEEATKDLLTRLFAEVGTADTPNGKVPSINVGFTCKVKEFGRMGEVTNRLRKDISEILGLREPGDQPF